MDKVLIYSQTAIHTLDHINMVNLMAKGNINGKMVVYMLENSGMDLNMVEANGRSCKMFKTVTVMTVSMRMIRKMDMVYLHGKVEMSTKEIIKTMKEMATEKCFGSMAHIIKVSGEEVSNMDKEK